MRRQIQSERDWESIDKSKYEGYRCALRDVAHSQSLINGNLTESVKCILLIILTTISVGDFLYWNWSLSTRGSNSMVES